MQALRSSPGSSWGEELAARLRSASLMAQTNLITARTTAERSRRVVAAVHRRRAARGRAQSSGHQVRVALPPGDDGHLRRQLATLPVIEQAKGIIMAERHCSDKEALALLRRMSQHTNTKVSDVAVSVVTGRGARAG